MSGDNQRPVSDEWVDRVFDAACQDDGDGGASSGAAGDLAALRGLKDLCARALTEDAPLEAELQARRVARRVLSRTTREDLGRRGDLGVVLEFFGDRLRDSVLLRVAVAALVVQVTIVPLVAWHLLSEPTRGGVRFVLEPTPDVDILDEFPAEVEPFGVVGGSNWWELEGAEPWVQADADFAGARGLVQQVRSSLAGSLAQPTSSTGVALADLTGLVQASGVVVRSTEDGPVPMLDSVLLAEAALERIQGGGAWAGVGETLESVGQTLTLQRAAVDSAPPGPVAVLASRTLARAAALGLVAPASDPKIDVPAPAEWLLLIGREALRAAPKDPFVQDWNRVVQEL